MTKFTAENYGGGFLMDEELMAGISESKEAPGVFTAFVVRHTTGETLGVQNFTNLFEALRTLNDIPREWEFQSASKCGGNCAAGGCGKNGGAGGCGARKNKAASTENSSEASDCSSGSCPV
jgi:hypothetical protein